LGKPNLITLAPNSAVVGDAVANHEAGPVRSRPQCGASYRCGGGGVAARPRPFTGVSTTGGAGGAGAGEGESGGTGGAASGFVESVAAGTTQVGAGLLGGKGDVIIIDHPEVASVQDRTRGFRDAMKEFPGVNIVQSPSASGQRARAMTVMEDMNKELDKIAATVHKRLTNHLLKGRTITLKIKYSDFKIITRSRSFSEATNELSFIAATAKELLAATEPEGSPIRLLGITISNFGEKVITKQIIPGQLPLFDA